MILVTDCYDLSVAVPKPDAAFGQPGRMSRRLNGEATRRGPWAVGRGPWAVGRVPCAVCRGPWAVGPAEVAAVAFRIEGPAEVVAVARRVRGRWGSRSGGLRFAQTALRCAGFGTGAELASLTAFVALGQQRRVCLRGAHGARCPEALCSSTPPRSPHRPRTRRAPARSSAVSGLQQQQACRGGASATAPCMHPVACHVRFQRRVPAGFRGQSEACAEQRSECGFALGALPALAFAAPTSASNSLSETATSTRRQGNLSQAAIEVT